MLNVSWRVVDAMYFLSLRFPGLKAEYYKIRNAFAIFGSLLLYFKAFFVNSVGIIDIKNPIWLGAKNQGIHWINTEIDHFFLSNSFAGEPKGS